MTSGVPLSDEEVEYIREHLDDGAGRIAFDLGWKFAHLNGGHRSRRTVRSFIYRMQHSQIITLHIPAEWLQSARGKGILREELVTIGEQAVIQFIQKADKISLL
jgi:hypothetical protein